jgi:hypothetical protein
MVLNIDARGIFSVLIIFSKIVGNHYQMIKLLGGWWIRKSEQRSKKRRGV